MNRSPSQTGAAILMALIILTVLMLLGLPFLLGQRSGQRGVEAFARSLASQQSRANTEALGMELVALTTTAQANRQADATTAAYSSPYHDINAGLAPGQPDSLFIDTDPTTGRLNIDLPMIYGDLWTVTSGPAGASQSLSITDLSGRLDVNAMGPAEWHTLFVYLKILDWDDNAVVDSEVFLERGASMPHVDTDDNDDLGELAEALGRHRFTLPGERYTSLAQIQDADTGHWQQNALGQTHSNPITEGEQFGLRHPLTSEEFARLQPFLTVNGSGGGRQGEIDIGSYIWPGLVDCNRALLEAIPGHEDPRGDTFQLLNNYDARDSLNQPSKQVADIWSEDSLADAYIQWIIHPDAEDERVEPPQNPRFVPYDNSQGGDHSPALAIVASNGINVNLITEPADHRDITSQILRQFAPSLMVQGLPLTALDANAFPVTAPWLLTSDLAREALPPTVNSSFTYRIEAAARNLTKEGLPGPLDARTLIVQAPPAVDLVYRWDNQWGLHRQITRRFANLLVSWPRPHARLPDDLIADTTLAANNPDPMPSLKTTPLLDPAVSRSIPGGHQAQDWYRDFTDLTHIDESTHSQRPTTADLTPDGLHLTSATRLAYDLVSDDQTTPDALKVQTNTDIDPIDDFHLGFWLTPQGDWSGQVPIVDIAGPTDRYGSTTLANWSPNLGYTTGTTIAGSIQERIAITYDVEQQCFLITIAGPGLPAGDDHHPPTRLRGSQTDVRQYDTAADPNAGALSHGSGANAPILHCYYWPLHEDPLTPSTLRNEAIYCQLQFRDSSPDGLRFLVNGVHGRDLSSPAGIRTFAAFSDPAAARAALRAGDHLHWPSPAVLVEALPAVPRLEGGNAVLAASQDRRRQTPRISLQTIPATLFGLSPHAWLGAAGAHGVIRIGEEFIAYDGLDTGSGNGVVTLLNCTRACRQTYEEYWPEPAPAPADYWQSNSEIRDYLMPAHAADSRVLPGGYTRQTSTRIKSGGLSMEHDWHHEITISGEVPSVVFDEEEIIFAAGQAAAFPADGGIVHVSGIGGWTDELYYTHIDGDTMYLDPETPVDRSLTDCTVTLRSLRCSLPDNDGSFDLSNAYHVSLRAVTNDSGTKLRRVDSYAEYLGLEVQLSDDTGAIEWVWFSEVRYGKARGGRWVAYLYDATTAQRNWLGSTTERTTVWPACDLIPIQRWNYWHWLMPSDRLTLVPRNQTPSMRPAQVVVRHVHQGGGYEQETVTKDLNGDGDRNDPGETVNDVLQFRPQTYFTCTTMPASIHEATIGRVICWPGWSPADDLSIDTIWTGAANGRYEEAAPLAPNLYDNGGADPVHDALHLHFGCENETQGGDQSRAAEALIDQISLADAPGQNASVRARFARVGTSFSQLADGDPLPATISQGYLLLDRAPAVGRTFIGDIDGECVAIERVDAEDITQWTGDITPLVDSDGNPNGFDVDDDAESDAGQLVRLIGRQQLGSEAAVIGTGSRLNPLPIGPVCRLAAFDYDYLAPLDKDFFWRLHLGANSSQVAESTTPAYLLAQADGSAIEAALLVPHSNKLHIVPWLRGAYNGPVLDELITGDDDTDNTLVIAWWPRFPSALPHLSHAQWASAEDWVKERWLRCRQYPFAGFALRLHDLHFNTTDPAVVIAADPDNPQNTTFVPELRMLGRGYNWYADATLVSDATANDSTLFNRASELVDALTAIDRGVELRVSWRYRTPFAAASNQVGDCLAEITRNAGRSPSMGPVTLRCRAPSTIVDLSTQ